jgi:glycosyltransferase involved in cell wall biosynthesis
MKRNRKVKLLVTLNASNISNFHADSGYVFLSSLLQTLLKLEPTWTATVLCPLGTPPIHTRVKLIQCLRAHNKYQARFDFPWNEIADGIREEVGAYDMLYINQPEIAANLLALVQSLRGTSIPSVAYIHYLAAVKTDCDGICYDTSLNNWNLGPAVLLRQCEAVTMVDRILVASNFAKDLLTAVFRKILGYDIKKSIQIIPPPADQLRSDERCGPELSHSPLILYNHRLYEHYGTGEILEWLEEFYKKAPRSFQLLATNPTEGRDKARCQLDPSHELFQARIKKLPFGVVQHCSSRSEYQELLSRIRVGLAPLREAPLWCMSAVDVMAAGRPVLAPDWGPYPDMLGRCAGLLYKDRPDFERKLARLLSDGLHWSRMAQHCGVASGRYAPEEIGEQFRVVFRELCV